MEPKDQCPVCITGVLHTERKVQALGIVRHLYSPEYQYCPVCFGFEVGRRHDFPGNKTILRIGVSVVTGSNISLGSIPEEARGEGGLFYEARLMVEDSGMAPFIKQFHEDPTANGPYGIFLDYIEEEPSREEWMKANCPVSLMILKRRRQYILNSVPKEIEL